LDEVCYSFLCIKIKKISKCQEKNTIYGVEVRKNTIYRCATMAQVASGRKSRPGNCRFIPVATQTVGQGDLPAEVLRKNASFWAAAIWQDVTRMNLEQASKVKS
jgi:hypothetical protein